MTGASLKNAGIAILWVGHRIALGTGERGEGFRGKNLVAVDDSLREFISQSAQCKIVETVLGLFQPV